MNPTENFHHSLILLVKFGQLILEFIAVLCVFCGLIATFRLMILLSRRNHAFPFLEIRVRFGTWLVLALEFQLGSDIMGTTVAPSFEDLARLGIIAIIRTFLNYFLNKELEACQVLQKRTQTLN
ncbi:protein of unknown function DUF1622 [Gloeothece citriformis PCC 7424]|uniref:DUF1622 domain-containing protein n=1 Tax=Gloeothece citriformis (strain PCC 7424) TaxID=65393 RepID=B7KEF0_GLOC7|nr:DUF1622 domain-containing protein [Gloeothece citriformis]ACK73268.1 protein of unknown function DUF1622 [Gloeothece citriformis PCC 7424]